MKRLTNEQYLDRIRKRAKELNRIPRTADVKGVSEVVRRFGSWSNALYQAGLLPKLPKRPHTRYRAPIKYGEAPDIDVALGHFIAGLVAGEGSFMVGADSLASSIGICFRASFSVGLHKRDLLILETMQRTLQCGHISICKRGIADWHVCDRREIIEKVIPFFRKFGFRNTYKQQQFDRFCEVIELLNQGVDATSEGQERIKQLASLINGRSKKRE